MGTFNNLKEQVTERVGDGLAVATFSQKLMKGVTGTATVLVLLFGGVGFYWDSEPDLFDVTAATEAQAALQGRLLPLDRSPREADQPHASR